MIGEDYILLVFGMGLVTYLPRWTPLLLLTSRCLPEWLIAWLDLVPAAILSALLTPALLTGGAPRQLLLQPELLAAVPTFLFAWRTKSLGGTVVVGMLLYWGIGRIF